MQIIIDGYNLIFRCGLEGRSRSPSSLEQARNRLVEILSSSLAAELCARTTIVFDAKRLPIGETEIVSQKSGITVMFAVNHDDADSLIEELILKNSSPKQLTVVSSDHRIQKAALRRKATPIDSDVWYDRLDKLGGPESSTLTTTGATEEKDDLDKLQNIDWANEFGLTDRPTSTGDEATTHQKDANFNPFPPGYADDLLDDRADDD